MPLSEIDPSLVIKTPEVVPQTPVVTEIPTEKSKSPFLEKVKAMFGRWKKESPSNPTKVIEEIATAVPIVENPAQTVEATSETNEVNTEPEPSIEAEPQIDIEKAMTDTAEKFLRDTFEKFGGTSGDGAVKALTEFYLRGKYCEIAGKKSKEIVSTDAYNGARSENETDGTEDLIRLRIPVTDEFQGQLEIRKGVVDAARLGGQMEQKGENFPPFDTIDDGFLFGIKDSDSQIMVDSRRPSDTPGEVDIFMTTRNFQELANRAVGQ